MKSLRRCASLLSPVVAILLLAIAGSCVQARGEDSAVGAYPELLSQLPAGASTLLFIDLASIRGSAFFQSGAALAPIKAPEHDYAAFVQATGFDYQKDLDRAVIAVWPQPSSSPSAAPKYKTVILAEGRFDRKKIRDYAMQKGKVEHEAQHEVFVFPAQNQAGSIALVFLNDHRVAMVEGSDAAAVLAQPAAAASDDPVREQATQIDTAPVFAISRMPPIPQNFSFGSMQSAQLGNILRSLQWITLTARPDGDSLRVSLEGVCATDSDARQIATLLELVRSFGQAALNGPQARQKMDPASHKILETFLQAAEIGQSAERVRIRVELTQNELKSLGSAKPSQK